ncbi:MAG TPA: phosphatidylglycerophosphatase A [Burkholderiales bacterium]|nr:phosphatidylglycerophosphatase A [Burkholderiales bacterium]
MSWQAAARPGAGFLVAHPAHFIALGLGTGLSPVVPGTLGTLLAFPLYAVLAQRLAPEGVAVAIAALFAIGIWACGRTGRDLGVPDHGAMNWDEVVAFLGVLLLAPAGLSWQVAAFLLFRLFDMTKPPPIRHLERTVKGGFGVMLDDVVAAFYTLLALAAAKRLLG